jgi:hypothetical protein
VPFVDQSEARNAPARELVSLVLDVIVLPRGRGRSFSASARRPPRAPRKDVKYLSPAAVKSSWIRDRLLHRSALLNIRRRSYRLQDLEKLLK